MSNDLIPLGDASNRSIQPLGPDGLVDAFLAGRSADTLRAYDADLRDFGRFLGDMTGRQAVRFLLSLSGGPANELVLRYRNHLTDRKLAPATIGRRLAAIRSVVRLGRTLGYCSFAIEIEDPRVQKYRDTRGPGLEGWRSMRVTAEALADGGYLPRNAHPHQPVRDLAIVQLLRGLALRRSSVVRLDLADVELDGGDPGLWIFEKRKAQKVRRSLSPGPVQALQAWIAVRGDWPGPLFHRLDRAAGGGGDPGRLTGSAVYDLVKAMGHRAGLIKRVRPHGLRHEAITAAIDRGAQLPDVQEFAGHADPRTTMGYYDRHRNAAGKVARLIDGD